MNIWNLILVQPLLNLLILFYNFLGHNMGIAIIVLTLLVRLAFFPQSLKAILVQKKNKELQPHLDRIKKEYGHDKQKLAQAQMELYKQHGVNPLSSCLPLLIQFPIFIALYQVFFKLAQAPQLDMLYSFISKPDTINTHFLWLNLAKPDSLYIMPILAGASMFWQSKMMTPQDSQKSHSQDPKDSEQKTLDFQKMFSKQMLYLFPIMSVFIVLRLPSALALYWVVTTLFGIAQQYFVLRGGFKSKATQVVVRKRE